MGFLDLFRRPAPIRDVPALADFIDQNAAFLVQKGIYEYARARAGVYAKILFSEKPFIALIDQCRWRAFPLGLAMVGELVEGALKPEAGTQRLSRIDEVRRIILSVFDRYPVPESIGAADWAAAREELGRRITLIGLHPPKPTKDIPEPYVDEYFALMPIHEKLKALDYPSIRAYMKVSLCNIHDVFVARLDAPALTTALNADTT